MDGDFKTISLSDFKGKYVVLFFCEWLPVGIQRQSADSNTAKPFAALARRPQTRSLRWQERGCQADSLQCGHALPGTGPFLGCRPSAAPHVACSFHPCPPLPPPRQTLWTGPLCAPPRSLPSVTVYRSSGTSAWKWVLARACGRGGAAPAGCPLPEAPTSSPRADSLWCDKDPKAALAWKCPTSSHPPRSPP